MIRKPGFWLLGILILAAALRIVVLGGLPNGLNCDEASTGYDAYSLSLTGRNQYGEYLPLFSESLGESDESIYRFLAVLPVRLFGLNEFSTRLPSAIFGVLTVLAVFLLARELYDAETGLAAALLLTISPWHWHFSRIAFRGILFPCFFCFALYFFLRGLKKPGYLVASALLFSLSLYTYTPARAMVPVFLVLLSFLCHRSFRGVAWPFWASLGIVLAALLILGSHWLSPTAVAGSFDRLTGGPAEWGRKYLSYFSPSYLFFSGDPELRHSMHGYGQLHHFEIVTVLAGLVMVVRERRLSDWILILWMLLYPFPAALADPTHSIGTIIGAPLFAIVSARGLRGLARRFSQRSFLVIAALVIALSVGRYSWKYFGDYRVNAAEPWDYGIREAITIASEDPAAKIYLSDKFFAPHVFILFYGKYPPGVYQADPLLGLTPHNLIYTDVQIGRYYVDDVTALEEEEECLIIAFPQEEEGVLKQPGCRIVKEIRYPDGTEAFVIIKRDKPQSAKPAE